MAPIISPTKVTTVADDHRSTAPKNVFHARQLLHWEQSSTVEAEGCLQGAIYLTGVNKSGLLEPSFHDFPAT
jgi:hypothetical protein